MSGHPGNAAFSSGLSKSRRSASDTITASAFANCRNASWCTDPASVPLPLPVSIVSRPPVRRRAQLVPAAVRAATLLN